MQSAVLMRQTLKFLHTASSCGIVGALIGYMLVLLYTPQDTPRAYADARSTISTLCNGLLIPSLAISLVTGLLAMAVHKPFMERRWAWVKAALGISMFEATLGIVQSKATTAAVVARKIASGEAEPGALGAALSTEWTALGTILFISAAQIALGVYRPKLKLSR